MIFLHTYWYIPAFVLIEGLACLLMLIEMPRRRARASRDTEDPLPGPMPPTPSWRLVELLVIVYHFPLVVPLTALSRSQSVSYRTLAVLTPLVYSAIVFGIQRLIS